ncbi:MAG: hypothetical protein E7304_11265 [Butyrivibrio sp.]|jgi:hypothetical protein|uniref:hypothetical protein n=1 Tax=Butyrivibrio sp. TaxID=28121 RepID=UPI001ECA26C5|nr:hypothetical protein [Butyrivibrio sp.]MBE5841968.1 hypothetical protein [Butyrivibrio sp.]
MNKFIENLNIYLGGKKIKNSYISLITGWDKSKVSRILNGEVEIKMADAEELASMLGKDIAFFLGDKAKILGEISSNKQFSYCNGYLKKEDNIIARQLLEMFRYYDALVYER